MKSTFFAVLVSGLLLTGSANAQELLVNPGFDTAGTGWGNFGSTGFNDFFGGNEHASLFADTIGNSGGIFQTGISGVAGQEYLFELSDTRIESQFDASLSFGLEFYQGDDATKISEVLVAIPDPGVEVNGGVYSMTAVAPAGTAFIRPIALFDSVASSGGQRNVFIFDASLTAVPEPTTLILAGLAGIVTLCGMRRRN